MLAPALTAARSRRRYRRIALAAGAGVVLKIVTVATGFVSVPLALRYLGREQFGVWMAFMGCVGLLQFSDLGLGVGLQNHLTECDGRDDRFRPRRLLSSTQALMLLVSAALVVGAMVLLPRFPLHRIMRTQTEALLPCAQMFAIAFAIVLPLGLVQYVCNAYQRGYITSGCLTAAKLTAFAGVLVGIYARLPLWWFVFAATLAPAPAYLAAGGAILGRKPWLRPALADVSAAEVRRVVALGLPGFGAQVGATLMTQGPLVVIASGLGAAAVASFAITQQLLSVSGLLLNVVIGPLWPAYGEAAARRDVAWIARAFRRSLLLSATVSGAAFAAAALLGRAAIRLWTGRPDVVPDFSLLMACNVWGVVLAWNRACGVLLNGTGHMLGQATYGTLAPLFAVLLAYVRGPQFGVAGVIWIIILAGESIRAACLGAEVRRLFRRLRTTP